MKPALSRLLSPVFTVLDPHAFLHWIEAIPGVRALPVHGKRYRLLFERGIPSIREDHSGRKLRFDFIEELQIHLLSWNAAALIRELAPYPTAEAVL